MYIVGVLLLAVVVVIVVAVVLVVVVVVLSLLTALIRIEMAMFGTRAPRSKRGARPLVRSSESHGQ